MSAYVSQSLLDEWVIESRMLQVAQSYRDYAYEGRKGEFLQMLVRSIKGISFNRRQVWKDFIEAIVPKLDKDVAEYTALQKAFVEGKPKAEKRAPRRRK